MDPLRLCIALGPLAIYLLVIGGLNLRRRPVLVSGARDTAALGIGVSGLLLVGPIELFLPSQTHAYFGQNVWMMWLMVLAAYGMSLTLFVLLSRPRLTIYNLAPTAVRPVLAEVLDTLDPDARWAGNSLVLPRMQIELHLESNAAMRNISLVAASDEQNFQGWKKLETALAAQFKTVAAKPSTWGVMLSLAGLAIAGRLVYEMAWHSQEITQSFYDLLRL